MEWSQVANAAASAAVAVAAGAFVGIYAWLAPTWHRSEAGRHVMAMSATLGALGVYTVLATIWPRGPVVTVLRIARVVIIMAVAGLLIQRTRMVVRAQRKGGDGDAAA